MINQELKEKKLKISRFASLVRLNPPVVYHSLLMSLNKLTLEEHAVYSSLSKNPLSPAEIGSDFGNSLERLINQGLVVPSKAQEQAVYKKLLSPMLQTNFTLFYLLITDACNLRCRYCFEENNLPLNFHRTLMSSDIMRKGIDLFAKNCSRQADAHRLMYLYGGEPLLNPKVVLEAADYLQERYSDLKISPQMVTNGSLVDKNLAEELAKRKIVISVSIDGPKEVHDAARICRSGSSSFEEAARGYNYLRQAGCKDLSISLTIGAHNARNLKNNVERMIEEFSPSGFGFNFLIGSPEQLGDLYADMDEVTDQVIETFKILRTKGIFEDRMMRKLQAFVERRPHLKDCGGVGNQLVITPKGYAGPCHGFASTGKYFRPIAELMDKDLKQDAIFNEWNERYPLNMPACLDCQALGVCGGGCPYHSYLLKGDIRELDERMCRHNKKVLNWIIQEAIDLEHGAKS